MKKNVVILGSTGSIGRQAMEVISWFPDNFRVVGLAAHHNIDLLEQQVIGYGVPYVAVSDTAAAATLKQRLAGSPVNCFAGEQGLVELVRLEQADLILVAVSGTGGLLPTLEGISAHKEIALANKETMVAGGNLVLEAANREGVKILPVDSEHSAIFQCLNKKEEVDHLILTGSGGPFRQLSKEQLAFVTPELALRHPTWSMGAKIAIDSATLMNKGLEVIEAHWLFGIKYQQIEVVIHPQSIIHSLVAYQDGVVLAQLGWPDMRVPIQYALLFPERRRNYLQSLDLAKLGQLTFEQPRLDDFPCLRLAREAGVCGGTMPVVLNAANEVAVAAFLAGRLSFNGIAGVVAEAISQHNWQQVTDLEGILDADRWSREMAGRLIAAKS